MRYTTIQNWSGNVYNLVTKRAFAYKDALVEWVDGNIGSKLGINDFINPSAINGNVMTSGIIKCLRSIKKMIIKKKKKLKKTKS